MRRPSAPPDFPQAEDPPSRRSPVAIPNDRLTCAPPWFNNRRLLEPIGNIPPAEAEGRYYAMMEQPAMAA